jgi:hypothetical protein
MNDTQYIEAARHMARRTMVEGGSSQGERLAYAFRLATGRKPSDDEAAVLLKVFERHRATFQAEKPAAEQLLSVGQSPRTAEFDAAEHAAYTMVCNLILNLDEVVTKE